MILDSEEQKQILLKALMSVEIKGDYQGLSEMWPKLVSIVDAVKSAEIAEKEADARG